MSLRVLHHWSNPTTVRLIGSDLDPGGRGIYRRRLINDCDRGRC
jgi:hypothetical protein